MTSPAPSTTAHLDAAHAALLEASAVDVQVATEAGVRSVMSPDRLPDELSSWRTHPRIAPGILFPTTGPDGRTVVQYRPDAAVKLEGEDRPRKYLFAKGAPTVVAVHPRMSVRLATARTILVVEGTKQHLAAVSVAPPDVLVVGIAGCQGWRSAGVPVQDWNHLGIGDSDVVIAFDADIATNRDVWAAGEALGEHLDLLGAATVSFLTAPTGAKAGLDDYLASVAPGRRTATLAALIERAGTLPKQPKAKKSRTATSDEDRFFDANGLRAVDLVTEVAGSGHHALAPDASIWTYDERSGIYVDDPHALVQSTRDLLGNRYRGLHHRTVLELLAAELARTGSRLPDVPIGRLVPLVNGMLDVTTGELHPHDPKHLAFARLAVEWVPDAVCPTFDRWLAERCGNQADDLLEAVALLLTPWAGQRKAVFLIGPTRSGKGTFMRVIEALIPPAHRSAETLHSLSTNRFAAAQLHGRILNAAGDLSDHHIDDLAMFKTLTGDDTVSVERKFRDSFTFRNTALFVFNANTPPTVAETSRAYLARVRPYLFPRSYEGHEDPSVEADLLAELPGILVRLVEAAQRWLERGGYTVVNPIVADLFSRASDPVAMFVAEVLEPDGDGFVSTADLHDAYKTWTAANGRATLGRNKLLSRADNVLGPRERARTDGTGPQGWRSWRVLPEPQWVAGDSSYAMLEEAVLPTSATSANFSPTSPHERNHRGEAQKGVIPREGEIGQKLAEVAEAPEPPEQATSSDPDDLIEMVF